MTGPGSRFLLALALAVAAASDPGSSRTCRLHGCSASEPGGLPQGGSSQIQNRVFHQHNFVAVSEGELHIDASDDVAVRGVAVAGLEVATKRSDRVNTATVEAALRNAQVALVSALRLDSCQVLASEGEVRFAQAADAWEARARASPVVAGIAGAAPVATAVAGTSDVGAPKVVASRIVGTNVVGGETKITTNIARQTVETVRKRQELQVDDCTVWLETISKQIVRTKTILKEIKEKVKTTQVEVDVERETLTAKMKEITQIEKHIKVETKKCKDKKKINKKTMKELVTEKGEIQRVCTKVKVDPTLSTSSLLQFGSSEVMLRAEPVVSALGGAQQAIQELVACEQQFAPHSLLESGDIVSKGQPAGGVAVDSGPSGQALPAATAATPAVVEPEALAAPVATQPITPIAVPQASQVPPQVEAQASPPIQPPPAVYCLPHSTDLNFGNAVLLSNNLGGQGPNLKDQPEIRLSGVGIVASRSIDLVVTATNAAYKPGNNSRNGKHGLFGNVNVGLGKTAELTFAFQDTATQAEIAVPEFYFTWLDIDQGKKGGNESLTLPAVEQFFVTKDHEFTKVYSQGTLTVSSTKLGHGCDNPTNPMALTNITCEGREVFQQRRAVTLEYTSRKNFKVILTASSGEEGGRNFLFAGKSSLVKGCKTGPRPVTPVTANTTLEAHCVKEETKLKEQCENVTTQITRQIVRTELEVTTSPCQKVVQTEWMSHSTLRIEVQELSKKLTKEISILSELTPRIEEVTKTAQRLKEEYTNRKKTCTEIPEINETLSNITDIVTSMKGCPGLEEGVHSAPVWAGIVEVRQDPQQGVKDLDAAMHSACIMKYGTTTARKVRAAEVAEIVGGVVENLPATNTEAYPILGVCPLCVSKKGKKSRVCWKQGKTLTVKGESGDCRSGPRAAVCVYAR